MVCSSWWFCRAGCCCTTRAVSWPASLSRYPEPEVHPLVQWSNGLGVALYAGLVVAIPLLWFRRHRLAALGVVWGLGTLAPVFQLVPLQNLVADRYLMLPLGGIALTLAALIPPGRVTGWLSGAILLGFAGSSVQLSGIWHSTEPSGRQLPHATRGASVYRCMGRRGAGARSCRSPRHLRDSPEAHPTVLDCTRATETCSSPSDSTSRPKRHGNTR